MATLDFTETQAIDRDSATRINPFIGCVDQTETRANVRAGLSALSLVIGSLAGSIGESEAFGLQLFADTLRAALTFENINEGGAL